ncbi:hypothetical protein [Haloarcula litorea]|uniref:hypothetical protein n=1 Tax=Haloarcula litorea TaxID=3032579 RepID=UPI0023E7C54D|nr:hypothetical protein [Halomicroarcula sp. GDY20]
MQIFDVTVAVLSIILYILFLFVLSLGIWLALTGGIGLAGGVLSVPVLYLLPDVRRFLVEASGGRPDDGTPAWRVALRPRYLLLSIAFGIVYGFSFLALFIPFSRLGLFPGRGEPTPSVALLPAVFILASALFAYGVHRHSSAWTGTATRRSVLAQWVVFLSVVVTVGTAIPYAHILT